MRTDRRVIGSSPVRKEAWTKVDGSAQYIADLPAAGACHGVLARAPHLAARILAIDVAAARAEPGVLAVLTVRDVPGRRTFGAIVPDQPVLADGVVRHLGEPVALVVAETLAAARKAAGQVRVDYEVLEPVLDPVAALEPGAVPLHPDGNLLVRYEIASGDIEAGLAGADTVLEETFTVQLVAPAYMEPESAQSRWNPDGTLTTWVSSQNPFGDRKAIAEVLGLPEERIQVVCGAIGGAFGGREDSSIAILASLAAWATRRTVRIVNSRWESFLAHPKRHPARLDLALGAKRDGTLTGLRVTAHVDKGAYASYGPAVAALLTEVAQGPYRVPNTRVTTNLAYTNGPYGGAMRGFGSPQAHFALESCLDMLAARLGLDPIAVRRKNILRPGDRLPTGVQVDAGAACLEQCLDIVREARERLRRIPPAPGKVAGVGLALALQSMGLGAKVADASAIRLEWMPDGRVRLFLGAPDLGQGLGTVAEQMVAEALELPCEQVYRAGMDSRTTPDCGVTCASRMTYLVGKALLEAAGQLRRRLLETAGRMLGCPAEALAYRDGAVLLPGGEFRPAAAFAGPAHAAGTPLEAVGRSEFAYPEATTPQHLPVGLPHVKFLFGGHLVRVEVDPDLGLVEVTHVVAVHDVGRIINRMALEGQIEGGIAMGIGYALYEDMAWKPARGWVRTFSEYLLPTSRDLPANLELHILEIPDGDGPYGAKGIGEICLVPTAPAIANAVQDALGVRIRDLPLTPDRILGQMGQVPHAAG